MKASGFFKEGLKDTVILGVIILSIFFNVIICTLSFIYKMIKAIFKLITTRLGKINNSLKYIAFLPMVMASMFIPNSNYQMLALFTIAWILISLHVLDFLKTRKKQKKDEKEFLKRDKNHKTEENNNDSNDNELQLESEPTIDIVDDFNMGSLNSTLSSEVQTFYDRFNTYLKRMDNYKEEENYESAASERDELHILILENLKISLEIIYRVLNEEMNKSQEMILKSIYEQIRSLILSNHLGYKSKPDKISLWVTEKGKDLREKLQQVSSTF
jgi:hypothetical protein